MPLAQVNPVGFLAIGIVMAIIAAGFLGRLAAWKLTTTRLSPKHMQWLMAIPLVLVPLTLLSAWMRWHEMIEWIVLPTLAFCLILGIQLRQTYQPRWLSRWLIASALALLLITFLCMPGNTILF
ncbi:MAG: hypothetical protein AB7I37_23125 [Pirellulales bacterium]